MSLFPRHTSLLIGGSSASGSFLAGTPALLGEDPVLTTGDWDTLAVTYALRRPTLTAEDLAALWPIGSQYGTRNFWVTGAKPDCIAPGVWTVAVQHKGFAATKPVAITWGCSSAPNGGHIVLVGSQVIGRVPYGIPTFTCKYITTDVSSAPVGMIGVPGSSLNSVWNSANPNWTTLINTVYAWPTNWMLVSMLADNIPGTSVAMISETYKYSNPALMSP